MSATLDDAAACARVYDETVDRVYGIVLSVVRDPAQAVEITEAAYLELWSKADEVDPPPVSVIALLITLAHRKAVEQVRGVDGHGGHDLANCERNRCAGARDDTLEAAEPSASEHLVRDTLAAWPDMQRHAIELAYFGGHSCLEVAHLLGTPLDSVRGWMREGLIRLRPTTVSANAVPGDTIGP